MYLIDRAKRSKKLHQIRSVEVELMPVSMPGTEPEPELAQNSETAVVEGSTRSQETASSQRCRTI